MEQTKLQGTEPERTEQARAKRREQIKRLDVGELRLAHEVPANATFVGFVVRLCERGEFLVLLDETLGSAWRGYGEQIDEALLFEEWDTAVHYALIGRQPATVAAAFELGRARFAVNGEDAMSTPGAAVCLAPASSDIVLFPQSSGTISSPQCGNVQLAPSSTLNGAY